MKCDFPKGEGEDTCKRCKSGGYVCIVEGRRQRIAPKLVTPSCLNHVASFCMTFVHYFSSRAGMILFSIPSPQKTGVGFFKEAHGGGCLM